MTHSRIFLAIVLAGSLVACSSNGTGVPYADAVQRSHGYLKAQEGDGIFALRRNGESPEMTELKFGVGNRYNIADFVAPLRITVEIRSIDGGEDSSIAVEAFKHQLLGPKRRDREARAEWTDRLHEQVKQIASAPAPAVQ